MSWACNGWGTRVYVVDEIAKSECVDTQGRRLRLGEWPGRHLFESRMKSYGIWPDCALLRKSRRDTHGLSYDELTAIARTCDLLIVRSGRLVNRPELTEPIPCRVYIDGNPGVPQVLLDQGKDLYDLGVYTHLFTIGQNLGTPACPLPLGGLTWQRTFFPVDLDRWRIATQPPGPRFTTISSWGDRTAITWQGQAIGEKHDSWLQFVELAQKTDQPLEIAINFDPDQHASEIDLFRRHGWHLANTAKPDQWMDYRDYIAASRGEFSIAHPRVVRFQVGWLSDRTSRYLACGRPALVQSTGLECHLPTGKGLLTFRTMEEAVAGLEEINRDYPMHCRAARAIAEEYLDAEKILARLLSEVGL